MKRKLLSLSLPVIVAGCVSQPPSLAVHVPGNLQPPDAEVQLMTVIARGAQIYECRASKDDPTTMEWAFVAPDADLFDAKGQKVGRHYAGPNWQSVDGSNVLGKTKATAAAPRPGAVPWLLLTTKSTGPDGVFAKVTSVQRIDTVGGTAPAASDCTAGVRGKQWRAAYTANYVMFQHR